MSYPPPSVRVQRTRRLLHVSAMLRDMVAQSRGYPLDSGVRHALAEAARAVDQAMERQRQDARREIGAVWATTLSARQAGE